MTLLLMLGLPSQIVWAQATDFIIPGTSGRGFGIPDKQTFDDRIEEAPWDAGAIHLAPWIGIRDATNVASTNVGTGTADDDDFTLTAGAGLRAYLRSGPRVVWAAHALPEYTWWANDDNRRRFNGRYGVGGFFYLNRLELEISQRLVEEQQFFSSEVQRLTPNSRAISRAVLDLHLARSLWLSVNGERIRRRNKEDGNAVLASLDRTEEDYSARLDFRSPRGWEVGIGYHAGSFDFARGARDLSSDSDGLVFDALFTGNRFAGLLQLRQRRLEPKPGSELPASDETTGVLQTVWEIAERSALLTYYRRALGFSVSDGASFFVAERAGARWQAGLGDRLNLSLYAEIGEDQFEARGTSGLVRLDDVTSFGGDLEFSLRAEIGLRLQVQRSEFDSSDPAFDRDVTTFGIALQLRPIEKLSRKISERLRLGSAAGVW
ncbi:MAG: hypothetical protein D6696_16215 [Acidobacteria bacterium]|nr:MAG: hypothetical protein D6696_16215 [Acidobacteriota bacterium]